MTRIRRPMGATLRLLTLARLASRMAVECCYFVGVLGTAAFSLGADAWGLALMMLVNNFFGALGMVVSGPLCDRIGPRRTILLADALLTALFLFVAITPVDMAGLGVFTALWTLAMGVQTTGFVAFPPHLVGRSELRRANGLMETASNVAVVLGPLLGGAMTLVWPVRSVFVVGVVCSAASAVLVWPLRGAAPADIAPVADDSPDDPVPGAKAWLSYQVEGFRVTFGSPALRLLLAMGFLGFFVFGAFDCLESLFYRDVLQVGVDWMGWLTAACGVGCVAGSLVMMRLPRPMMSLRGCAAMTLVMGVGTMVYVGTDRTAVAALGQLIIGVGWGMLVPTQNLLVQERTPLPVVGRVSSVMRIGFQSAGVLPLFVAPPLAEAFGPQAVLFGAATFCACVGLGFWLVIPRAKSLRQAA